MFLPRKKCSFWYPISFNQQIQTFFELSKQHVAYERYVVFAIIDGAVCKFFDHLSVSCKKREMMVNNLKELKLVENTIQVEINHESIR